MTTALWLQVAAIMFGILVGLCVVLGVRSLGTRRGWWW